MESEESAAKRTRAPGVQYPGASLATVLELLSVLDGAGGSSSIGRVAAKMDMAEGAATFKRVLISARGYGLARWANTDKSVLEMTESGRLAVGGDVAVLQRALVMPPTFRTVARRFNGRALPVDGLAEAFRQAGVAPAGAQLAADNFEASAYAAGAISEEGGRKILTHDLPFDAVDSASEQEDEASTKRAVRATPRPAASKKVQATSGVGGTTPASAFPGQPIERAPIPGAGALRPRPSMSIELRFDLAGWSVDQVVELVRRLRDEDLG